MFLAGNFLFTSSDTFSVGCIVQSQKHSKNNEPTKIRRADVAGMQYKQTYLHEVSSPWW